MMKTALFRTFGVVAALLLLSGTGFFSGLTWAAAGEPQKDQVLANYGKLPLSFIENQGQVNRQVNYYAQGLGHSVSFTREGLVLTLHQANTQPQPGAKALWPRNQATPGAPEKAVVRVTPVGMRPGVEPVAAEPQEGKVNYFIGNDPKNWRTDIPTYGAVVYREAYPGIDLKFYGNGLQLEYDLIVQPGADPGRVKFRYTGIQGLEVTKEGDLAIRLPDGGTLVQKKPLIYQEISGQRVPREGKFRVLREQGQFLYGFDLAAYDRRYPLVIDPVLVYSTFLGGSFFDIANAIAVDGFGNAYVTGQASSANFPVTPKAFQDSLRGAANVFVTKLNRSGSALVYSTFLGGSGEFFDEARGIAVDYFGNAYVTGFTGNADFPTTPKAFQTTLGSPPDVFVTKLNRSGSALVYSTFLGGSSNDVANGIAVDIYGNAYVTGGTDSGDFPTTPRAFQTSFGSFGPAFVTKLNRDGSALVYSTFLGGGIREDGRAIALDSAGNAYVTGTTFSGDFPITSRAFQPLSGGAEDAFVTKFNPKGSALIYSTFVGGSGREVANAIAVDGFGNAYVTGITSSTDFPATPEAFQPLSGGAEDAFVTKLNPMGSALIYSTFLGGNNSEEGKAIAVDANGNAHVTGTTGSTDFPTTLEAFQASYGGGLADAFVTRIAPNGKKLLFSTFLGGSGPGFDEGRGIAVDAVGNAYVTGFTNSPDFPSTPNVFQPSMGGVVNAFVTKIRPVNR